MHCLTATSSLFPVIASSCGIPSFASVPCASCPDALTFPGSPCEYRRSRLLGRGGFASVYEMRNSMSGHTVAVKVISKLTLSKPGMLEKLRTEISIHKSLSHPYIVQYIADLEDADNVYIAQELCSGHTISDLVRKKRWVTERQASQIMRQVLSAVQYLHEHAILHRDLKLSNVFIDTNGNTKLGDFGLACHVSSQAARHTSICGTPNYLAPEVLTGKSGYGLEVDIWCIGVMLFTMLTGQPPFETKDARSTYERIQRAAYMFPEERIVSKEAQDLIHRILRADPAERPSLEAILVHPFFTRFSAPATALHLPTTITFTDMHVPNPLDVGMVLGPLSQPPPSAPAPPAPLPSSASRHCEEHLSMELCTPSPRSCCTSHSAQQLSECHVSPPPTKKQERLHRTAAAHHHHHCSPPMQTPFAGLAGPATPDAPDVGARMIVVECQLPTARSSCSLTSSQSHDELGDCEVELHHKQVHRSCTTSALGHAGHGCQPVTRQHSDGALSHDSFCIMHDV